MSTETETPQAAPIQWRPASGNKTHSVCGVYRIEIHTDGCRVFARGEYLGHATDDIHARQLCRCDRQREFEMLGGWRQDGDPRLWPTKYPTKYDSPWRFPSEGDVPEPEVIVAGVFDETEWGTRSGDRHRDIPMPCKIDKYGGWVMFDGICWEFSGPPRTWMPLPDFPPYPKKQADRSRLNHP